MCGINGIITTKDILNMHKRIDCMNNSLSHRGPDASGAEVLNDRKIALGHRRLAVVDLDHRSNQPMYSEDRTAIFVFNGEIYNFKELRKEINYPFCTESDTEVLMAGIKGYGIDWIKKCNGMFSFAYYNLKNRQLILGRDRLGIKPLYYYCNGDTFIFSSEIKGILNSGLVKAEFNADFIDGYLANRYIIEPYTFFKDIYQLPAGCYMLVSERLETKIVKYWDLPEEFNTDIEYNEDVLYSAFKQEVYKAIKRRMMADVPIGTYLSGGIDSSIISAVAACNTAEPLNTYTIGFPEMNEFEYARLVASKYNTNHHEIVLQKNNYFDLMEEIIKYKDAPLGVPNEIPLALMSKELKKDITVVLSGEGADELMGGYGRIFRLPFDFENIDINKNGEFYDYFISYYEYVPREIRNKFFSCNLSLRKEFDKKIKEEFKKHSNQENVFRFFHNYHIKGLLQRVDITTMYASVEARVPFLDHELIEFCYRNIPYSLKLKWRSEEDKLKASILHSSEYSEICDEPKYLLRRLGLELLPKKVVTRKKMGFPVPLTSWFTELEAMSKEMLISANWLKKGAVEELCEDCRKNIRAGQILWMFINIELFRRLYFERNWMY